MNAAPSSSVTPISSGRRATTSGPSPANLFDSLTSAECEAIAERFCVLMRAQDLGRSTPKQTITSLIALYDDAREWVAERSPNPATKAAA